MRFGGIVWALVLGILAVQTCSYVVRSLPRFSRTRRGLAGRQTLRCGATSGLIEATACQVLRLVLRNGREAHVSCSVKSDARELLQGRLRGASVAGRGWASRLGLTARSIDVHVGSVNLDISTLFRRQVLQFQRPHPSGNAVVVFNAQDFGNFLAHPLIRRTRLAGSSFVFDRDGVTVDPGNRTVEFGGTWGGNKKLRIALSQASARESLVARVAQNREHLDDEKEKEGGAVVGAEEAAMVASELGAYFNHLEVDLDGPSLSFSSLSFEGGGGVEDGRVKLSLGIVVRKLPSIRAVASF